MVVEDSVERLEVTSTVLLATTVEVGIEDELSLLKLEVTTAGLEEVT